MKKDEGQCVNEKNKQTIKRKKDEINVKDKQGKKQEIIQAICYTDHEFSST